MKKFYNHEARASQDIAHSRVSSNTDTVISLLQTHAQIEAHFPVWTPKMPIFQANFPKV